MQHNLVKRLLKVLVVSLQSGGRATIDGVGYLREVVESTMGANTLKLHSTKVNYMCTTHQTLP